MERETIKKRLHRLIGLDDLHSWDVETHIDRLTALTPETREEVFRQILVIWPVSYALCFAFLDQLPRGLACLRPSQLSEWVKAILDVYESSGLQAANRFMAEVEKTFLCRLRGEDGITLDEAAGRLRPYILGLAGYELELVPADQCSTDTTSVSLPRRSDLFKEPAANFLFYKLAASLQWAFIATGTFRLSTQLGASLMTRLQDRHGKPWLAGPAWLANFFHLFPDPCLAADLFLLAETVRATAFLSRRLPGLIRDAAPVRDRLLRLRPNHDRLTGKGEAVEKLKQWALSDGGKESWTRHATLPEQAAADLLAHLGRHDASPLHSAGATAKVYDLIATLPGSYQATPPIAYAGILQPERVEQARLRRRDENRARFIKALAAILPKPNHSDCPPTPEAAETAPAPARQPLPEEAAILPPGTGRDQERPERIEEDGAQTFLVIDDERLKLPEALQSLTREIRDDLGQIPRQYIASASQRAGSGVARGHAPDAGQDGVPAAGPLVYDEWDFRRNGFRKDWCSLAVKPVQPVRSTFVPATLEKYRGQLRRLRRQFEMLRARQRFVKRQQDGDDIDLDALIEARADERAGISPSQRLYVRLRRDQRDINAVFLVDMSSSTEGWVNTAIKEALVLMCESLTVLGDRYAIYGFSGMRRQRSELYLIKDIAEPYDDTVRNRIAAISPREYTRMGPPIRHLTQLLAGCDAKTRLLITLTDGKPEDYDDYKGDYAIEDTRHALIEARAAGIHPFCITIDRQAHDYIAHMYGGVNYIFIDEVEKLPGRMPQIYRTLTT